MGMVVVIALVPCTFGLFEGQPLRTVVRIFIFTCDSELIYS
jgi:hypothetical protein